MLTSKQIPTIVYKNNCIEQWITSGCKKKKFITLLLLTYQHSL